MTTMDAKTQYNGIILLTSYLQRIFVAETIYRKCSQHHSAARFELSQALLDEVHTIVPVFEETKNLTDAQIQQLQVITNRTIDLMQGYFKLMPQNFNDKLAVVGSSLYGEQLMNSGILRLGELFGIDINKDFHMRVKFYEDRTKVIDVIVHQISDGGHPDESIVKPIETWYNDIISQKDHILNDMDQITQMIGF